MYEEILKDNNRSRRGKQMEKERRTKALVIVVLLVVVAGLTVAFAALSATLKINGTAYLDASKWGIKFDNLSEPVSVGTAKTTGTAKIEETKSAEITDINVVLSTPGDKVTYTVDLVNEGTINAKIDKIEKTEFTSEEQKYLTFNVTDKDGNEINEGDVLASGEIKNLIITIEFKKDLAKNDLPASTSTISLSYKLNFVQTDEKSTSQGGSNTSNYGEKVKEWHLSDTINMTYYESNSTAESGDNKVKMMSNSTTETYKGGILVVSGTGDMPDDYDASTGSGTYANLLSLMGVSSLDEVGEEITFKYSPNKIVIEDGITKVGAGSFAMVPFNELELPSTLKKIGAGSFMGGGMTYDLGNLTSVIIPDSVEEIGDGAFSDRPIKYAKLPKNLKTISAALFQDTSLEEITIPSTVTSIGDGAFNHTNLTSISIPTSVTSIGGDAFSVTKLTNVVIPSSVTSIGASAFSCADTLETIYLPKSITNIEVYHTFSMKENSVIYCETEAVKNLLKPGLSSGMYDPEKTTIIVDSSKFN